MRGLVEGMVDFSKALTTAGMGTVQPTAVPLRSRAACARFLISDGHERLSDAGERLVKRVEHVHRHWHMRHQRTRHDPAPLLPSMVWASARAMPTPVATSSHATCTCSTSIRACGMPAAFSKSCRTSWPKGIARGPPTGSNTQMELLTGQLFSKVCPWCPRCDAFWSTG